MTTQLIETIKQRLVAERNGQMQTAKGLLGLASEKLSEGVPESAIAYLHAAEHACREAWTIDKALRELF